MITLIVTLLALKLSSIGHEPLWGETPQTFAYGIWHPELRISYENDSLLLGGSHRITNPAGLRKSRFDYLFSLQYAPQTALNLKLEIPYTSVWTQQTVGGVPARSSVSGLGDTVLTAKTRFGERFGPTWKVHQAGTLGLKLPTGAHSGRMPDGTPLAPSDQPGSGKWGFQAGYAFGYERLQDTTWLATTYLHDIGGAGSRGDSWTVDAAYGYWTVRPTSPSTLGVLVATGPHFESSGKDRVSAGRDPNTGFTLIGWEATFVATKDRGQARFGLMVPLYQRVIGTQLRPELQIRAGAEMFF